MRSLLDDWEQIARRFRQSASVALFLDFDGTLAPIVRDPSEASIDRAARAALLRLSNNRQVRAWVISGRRLADLRQQVNVPGLRYLGVHGGDTEGAAIPESARRIVAEAKSALAARLNGARGIRIEDKSIAFAVHYRGAGYGEVRLSRSLVDEIVAGCHGRLRAMPGDKVWEILPSEIRGKGHTVRTAWHTHAAHALPVYIGNDRTDEGAFAALTEGITARVGPAGFSHANYALRNCGEVARFLERLDHALRQKAVPSDWF